MNLGTIVSNAIKAVPGALRTTVIVGRVVPGTLNPATNVRTGDALNAFSVRAVVLVPEADKGQEKLMRARELLLAASDCGFEPQADDYVLNLAPEPTVKWRILSCKPTGPAGEAALYRVAVAR